MFRISLLFSLILLVNLNSNAQCYLNSNKSSGIKLSTTGSPKLDKILSDEGKILSEMFSIEVELYAYDDQDKPNAYANKACNTLNCDGSVRLGKRLLLDELVNSNGYVSIVGIMAHEFAHILQFTLKHSFTSKLSELQADFLAGWYLGKTKELKIEELEPFARSLYEKGDFEFWSTDHHGTPAERAEMMIQGFQYSNLNLEEAYYRSLELLVGPSANTNKSNNNDTERRDPPSNIPDGNKKAETKITIEPFINYEAALNNSKFARNPEIERSVMLAISLYATERNDECISILTELIKKYPQYSVAYYNRALAWKYKGDQTQVQIDLKTAENLGLKVESKLKN
jgi:hypothetical protein